MFNPLKAFFVSFVSKEIDLPLFNHHSKINLEMINAANTEENIPIINVVAKDSIGPVPNTLRTIAVNKVVTFASMIEDKAF